MPGNTSLIAIIIDVISRDWVAKASLSFAEENVTFRGMNYRRKKISMKEQLEEAMKEIGGEPMLGSEVERETPKKGFSGIEVVAPEFRQPHAQ